jgi:hypothetical protein
MRAEIFQQILSELETIPGDEAIKQLFGQAVRKTALANGCDLDRMKEREERVAYARQLRGLGDDRPTIRDRLMARFEISRSQAYDDIAEALQLQSVQKTG